MSKKHMSALFLIFMIAQIVPIGSYANDHGLTKYSCDLAFLLVQQISNGQDKNMRIDMATDLSVYIHENPQCGSDRNLVKEISSLLNDDNEGVAMGAAQALAYIGPNARIAIPNLLSAISKYNKKMKTYRGVILPSISAGDVFENALEKITGRNYKSEEN